MFEYTATLLAIVDGDTLKLDVDLGFRMHAKEVFRLARINCPELLSLEGMQARTFVAETLAKAIALKVQTSRSEKYGRWLAELSFQTRETGAQWHNLNTLLLTSGHAKPFKH
jgi:endonuclease YncB( thermonuclease family)